MGNNSSRFTARSACKVAQACKVSIVGKRFDKPSMSRVGNSIDEVVS
jgi:hypothetical protein